MLSQYLEESMNRISGGAITTAKICPGAFDDLSPIAKANWDQLGRRLELLDQFDAAHHILKKFATWPLIGAWYCRIRRDYILEREPQIQ